MFYIVILHIQTNFINFATDDKQKPHYSMHLK
jgi:hypothetical protein